MVIGNMRCVGINGTGLGFCLLFAALPAAAQETQPSLPSINQAEPKDEQREGLHGSVGAGYAIFPDYPGADTTRGLPFVTGRLSYGDRYIAAEGIGLRANLIGGGRFEFGPAATITFGRSASVRNQRIRALGVLDDSYMIGAFGAVNFPNSVVRGDQVRITVAGFRDVSGVSGGWTGLAAVGWTVPVTRRLYASVEGSASFADDRYARTYFGVTPQGAIASGLGAFRPSGGVKDAGVSVGLSYQFSRRWSLNGFAGYQRFVDSFERSPIVSRAAAGNVNQYSAGGGIQFNF